MLSEEFSSTVLTGTIVALLQKQAEGITLSTAEITVLTDWRQAHAENARLYERLQDVGEFQLLMREWYAIEKTKSANKERLFMLLAKQTLQPVPRIRFLRTGWTRYAAIFLLIAGVVIYWYRKDSIHTRTSQHHSTPKPAGILPGGNKATLTLADGSVILLDSTVNGNLAWQGATRISKMMEGEITYEVKDTAESKTLMNTMITPRGGQYKLILPDGTKIWLNAASSIRFPSAFTGTERRVEISGEAYFEVAQNKRMPFRVAINNKAEVEVLGTHFNINAYENEANIFTTLLEGSVKVNGAMLHPGEQAQIKKSTGNKLEATMVIQPVDTDKVMAWKNRLFNFKGVSLKEAMRQLERWYDVDVVYDTDVPDIRFWGEMSMEISLDGLITAFHESELRFSIERKTLRVSKR